MMSTDVFWLFTPFKQYLNEVKVVSAFQERPTKKHQNLPSVDSKLRLSVGRIWSSRRILNLALQLQSSPGEDDIYNYAIRVYRRPLVPA